MRNIAFGDLLHGMDKDPTWAKLKKEFIANYTPEQRSFRPKLYQRGMRDKAIDDMFIRGGLVPDQGDEWKDPKRYSDKQKEVLAKMKRYIETGQDPH